MVEMNQEIITNQPDGREIPDENPVSDPVSPEGELDITMSEKDAQKLLEQTQQMIQEEQPQSQQQQELIAGKFKSEEELQKGLINLIQKLTGTEDLGQVYKALESYLGKGGLEAAETEITEEETQTEENDLDSLLEQYIDTYIQTGQVPEELLKQTNADPKLVEYALKAKVQEYEQYVKSIVDYAGGEQEYQKILNFVEKNMTPEERAAYTAAILTGDSCLVSMVIDGVRARMQKATPELIEGVEATVPTGGDVFGSVDEALAAITDPRYGVDPRYTQMVQAKLIRSRINTDDLL